MPFAAVGAGVGAIGSLVGGGKQADATKSAANAQLSAAQSAQNLQANEFNRVQQNESPFLQLGDFASEALQNGVSPLIYNGFDPTSNYFNGKAVGTTFDAPAPFSGGTLNAPAPFSYTAADMQNDPGYQFTLDQGTQALQRSAAAQGNAFGGATQKAIAQYAENTANTFYNQDYQRAQGTYQQNYQNAANTYQQNFGNAFSTYNTNYQNSANTYQQNYGNAFNTYYANKNSALNGFLSLAQIGSGANGQLASSGTNMANQSSQIALSAGNSAAAGDTGTANAYASMYGGLSNSVNTLLKNSSFQSAMKNYFGGGGGS